MENTLNLLSLIPNFKLVVWGYIPKTPEELSALGVLILIGMASLFFLIAIWSFMRAFVRVRWINKQLKIIDKKGFPNVRADIKARAEKKRSIQSNLWLEFDKSLIEEDGQLFSTYDVASFFNTSTLAPSSTENRLLAAGPSFLTALGVIGTFIGLQLGLADLNIAGNVNVDQMKAGVAGVINGAKIAFITSVWGVALSVIFNIVEKFFEWRIKRSIYKLQRRFDTLIPQILIESKLQSIAKDGEESRKSLQGLAEKIGEKMQESLLQATSGIQQSLEESLVKIMAPAINRLVNETSSGNQKALESLLEAFMEKFGQQGTQQREAIDNASENMNSSLELLGKSLATFVTNLEQQQEVSSEREQTLIKSISQQVSALVSHSNEQTSLLTKFVKEQMHEMENNIEGRENAAVERERELVNIISEQVTNLVKHSDEQKIILTDFVKTQVNQMSTQLQDREKASDAREVKALQREHERNIIFTEQTDKLIAESKNLLAKIDESMKSYANASTTILNQSKLLQSKISESNSATVDVTQGLRNSTSELRIAADSIKGFSNNMRDIGNNLAESVQGAAQSSKELSEQNKINSEFISDLLSKITVEAEKISKITQDSTEQVSLLATFIKEQIYEMEGHFEERASVTMQREKELVQIISEQVSNLVKHSSEQKHVLTEFVKTQISHMSKQLQDRESASDAREEKARVREHERSAAFMEQTEKLIAEGKNIFVKIDESMKSYGIASSTILKQSEQLQSAISATNSATVDATQELKVSASELRATSDNIKIFSSEIKDAGDNLADSVNGAVNSSRELSEQNKINSEFVSELLEKITSETEKMNKISQNIGSIGDSFKEYFELASKLTIDFGKQGKQLVNIESQRSDIFVEQMKKLKDGTEYLLTQIDKSVYASQVASKTIIEQGKQLQSSVKDSVKASENIVASMKKSTDELNKSSNNINMLGTQVKLAGDTLAQSIIDVTQSNKDVAMQNERNGKHIDVLLQQIKKETEQFATISTTLQNMINNVDNSFSTLEKSQKSFLQNQQENISQLTDEMKGNVVDLSKEMSDWLTSYEKSVNSQVEAFLKSWASETTSYATKMNEAMNSLSNIVDEIEGKIGK